MNVNIRKIIGLALIGILAISATGCGLGNKVPDNAVAVVDGEVITLEDYNRSFAMVEKSYNEIYGDTIWSQEVQGQTVKDMVKSQLLDSVVTEQLMIKEVSKTDFKIKESEVEDAYAKFMEVVDKDAATKKFYTDKGIDEAFIKKQITSQLYKEEFDNTIKVALEKDQAKLAELYKTYPIQLGASHILVTDEAKAKDLLKKIKAGEDFAKLAKENSIDTGSAKNGGSLGLFPRGVMVPEFETAAFNLKIGEVSEIVQSKFGYHIIKVDEIQTLDSLVAAGAKPEEIEVYKRTILSNLTNDETKVKLAELKKNSKIQTFPDRIK